MGKASALKKLLSERDICSKYITPAVLASGYSQTKPIRIEEFAAEKNWWDKHEESEQACKVSIEEIKANGYNLEIKNPKTVEDELGDPEELPSEYKMLLKEVAEIREALKRELMSALGGDDE